MSFDTKETELKEFFRQIGKINEVRISYNQNGRSKGYAHVEFKYPEDVDKAVHKLNGLQIDGRTLRLDKAPERDNDGGNRSGGGHGGNGGNSGYYSDHSDEDPRHRGGYSLPQHGQ